MDRRAFLNTSSMLLAASVLPFPAMATGDELIAANADSTRLSREQLLSFGISEPVRKISPPTGGSVDVTMKAKIIRRYDTRVFVYFELSRFIDVFDMYGNLVAQITTPEGDDIPIHDFAIDTSSGSVYWLRLGGHEVIVTDYSGNVLNTLGEFGHDQTDKLNGPRSITIDSHHRVYVLDSDNTRIKVFGNNGTFLRDYSLGRFTKGRKFTSLDGNQKVVVSGGLSGERLWYLDSEDQSLRAIH